MGRTRASTIASPKPCAQPPPVQQPRPPTLIGGAGEKKTLRLVARYADACNLFGNDLDVVAHKLEVLEARHCEAENRDYSSIEKTILFGRNPLDDVDAFLSQMDAMAKLGTEKVWVSNRVSDPPAWASEVCEMTVSRLEELG